MYRELAGKHFLPCMALLGCMRDPRSACGRDSNAFVNEDEEMMEIDRSDVTLTRDDSVGTSDPGAPERLSLLPLLGLTIGSMVAGGIFALPSNIAKSAAAGPALIGWAVTAVGMFCLAHVFRYLSERRPELDAGVYAYARALLGQLPGFLSAWGYWVSAWIGNLAYFVLLFSTLSTLVPAFGNGVTWPAIAAASVLLWVLHFLILRGVRQAAFVNTLATFAKIIPLILFIVLAIIGFRFDLFSFDFWGTEGGLGSPFEQVSNMMLVTVWVFIGIEGASVYSARAKNRRDVGRATMLGFLGVLALLVLVNMLSYGAMKRAEIAELPDPSLAGVMEHLIGAPGAVIVTTGIVISLVGALLAWQLLCAEILQVAASDHTMPEALSRLNANGSPANAMWLTTACMQVALVATAVLGGDAYLKLITLASSMILIPYLFSALFGLVETTRDHAAGRLGNLIPAAIASLYSLWLLYAAGPAYLLLSTILYAPGLVVHAMSRRQRGQAVVKGVAEWALAIGIVILALVAIVALSQQWVSI